MPGVYYNKGCGGAFFSGIMVGRGPGKQLEEETEGALFENMRMCLGAGTVFAGRDV